MDTIPCQMGRTNIQANYMKYADFLPQDMEARHVKIDKFKKLKVDKNLAMVLTRVLIGVAVIFC